MESLIETNETYQLKIKKIGIFTKKSLLTPILISNDVS